MLYPGVVFTLSLSPPCPFSSSYVKCKVSWKKNWNKMLKNCVVFGIVRPLLLLLRRRKKISIRGTISAALPRPASAPRLPDNKLVPGMRHERTPTPRWPLGRTSAFKWQEIWKKLKFKSLIYESRFIWRNPHPLTDAPPPSFGVRHFFTNLTNSLPGPRLTVWH